MTETRRQGAGDRRSLGRRGRGARGLAAALRVAALRAPALFAPALLAPARHALTLVLSLLWAVGSTTPGTAGEPREPEPRPSEEEIGQTHVYASPSQAMEEIFGAAASVESRVLVLGEDGRARIEELLGNRPPSDSLVVELPRDDSGRLLGYAVLVDEVGKYRPITFLVGTTTGLEVVGVEVLVYRESRGGEVQKARFLRQYRGKTVDDPIRVNRDILNIAGATLSVRAMNRGVQRTLASLDVLLEKGELPRE